MVQKQRNGRRSLLKLLLLPVVVVGLLLIVSSFTSAEGKTVRLKSEEDRIAYLASFGWEVKSPATSEQIIRLPRTFPDVLMEYNELQKSQGFDLRSYAGKELTLYVYTITNYPNSEGQEVECSLYFYRNKLVGADIHSTAISGFMAPLR